MGSNYTPKSSYFGDMRFGIIRFPLMVCAEYPRSTYVQPLKLDSSVGIGAPDGKTYGRRSFRNFSAAYRLAGVFMPRPPGNRYRMMRWSPFHVERARKIVSTLERSSQEFLPSEFTLSHEGAKSFCNY